MPDAQFAEYYDWHIDLLGAVDAPVWLFDDTETVEAEVAECEELNDYDLMDDDMEDDEYYYS